MVAGKTAQDSLMPQKRIAWLTEQIQKSPNDYAPLQERASWHQKTGNTPAAIADMDKAIALYREGADLYYERGAYKFLQNDTAAAMRDFRQAAKLGTEEAENFYQMGQIFFLRQDYARAMKQYDFAIKQDSMEAMYPFAKGLIFEAQHRPKLALAQYERSIRQNPGFIKGLVQLHKLYLSDLKDDAKARAHADRILQIDPGHPMGRFIAGNMAFDKARAITDMAQEKVFQQHLSDAIMAYTVAVNRDSNFTQALYNRGYCYFMAAQYDQAIGDFEHVLRTDEHNANAHFMLGSIFEHFKDRQTAIFHYELAIQDRPDFADAKKAVKELKKN